MIVLRVPCGEDLNFDLSRPTRHHRLRHGLRLQQQLVDLRKEDQIGDVLLLLEHTPVITWAAMRKQQRCRISRTFSANAALNSSNAIAAATLLSTARARSSAIPSSICADFV